MYILRNISAGMPEKYLRPVASGKETKWLAHRSGRKIFHFTPFDMLLNFEQCEFVTYSKYKLHIPYPAKDKETTLKSSKEKENSKSHTKNQGLE